MPDFDKNIFRLSQLTSHFNCAVKGSNSLFSVFIHDSCTCRSLYEGIKMSYLFICFLCLCSASFWNGSPFASYPRIISTHPIKT